MFLFMVVSFSEQTVADIRVDIQKHVDNDEDERAHREDDKCDLGEVRYRMQRFVGDSGNEFYRGPRMTSGAGFYLVLTGNGRRGVFGTLDIVGAVTARA
jgi:hypothetical protein